MARDYGDAVAALNTLQSNFSIVDAIRKSGKGMNKQAIPEMVEWLRKAGYKPSDLDRLQTIHIAGTKGKGSTSAFISSILSQYTPKAKGQPAALKPHKIGLYTSPHLRFVRERIQIDNAPLPESLFAQYFFEVWDRLEASAQLEGLPTDSSAKPVYFRFLTLMAFHAYMREGVDTAVIEAGIGGEYDSTNILVGPTVTGITSLGIDHVAVLGDTIDQIAWHKAGIMKPGATAYTVPQPEAAMTVLRQRAAEKGVKLNVVQRHPDLDNIQLGLAADFQKTNASLAIAIAAEHLRRLGHTDIPADISTTSPLPEAFRRGLEQVRWGGRCETRKEDGVVWYIDGGHTLDSIGEAAKWYASQLPPSPPSSSSTSPAIPPSSSTPTASTASPSTSTSTSPPTPSTTTTSAPRILLFNQQTRDAPSLARHLHTTLTTALHTPSHFTHAIFTPNITTRATGYAPDLVSINTSAADVDTLKVQRELAATWAALHHGPDADADADGDGGQGACSVKVVGCIEDAVAEVRRVAAEYMRRHGGGGERKEDGEGVSVLVTGSLHLVGGVLEVLETGAGAGAGAGVGAS